MYKYRTKDGEDTIITGVGQTVNGEIETEKFIESPNLELIEGTPPETNVVIGDEIVESAAVNDNGVVGVISAQPNAITEATQIDPDNQNNEESN